MNAHHAGPQRHADEPPRHQFPMLRIRESSRDRGFRQNGETGRLPSSRTTELRGLAHRHGGEARKPRLETGILDMTLVGKLFVYQIDSL